MLMSTCIYKRTNISGYCVCVCVWGCSMYVCLYCSFTSSIRVLELLLHVFYMSFGTLPSRLLYAFWKSSFTSSIRVWNCYFTSSIRVLELFIHVFYMHFGTVSSRLLYAFGTVTSGLLYAFWNCSFTSSICVLEMFIHFFYTRFGTIPSRLLYEFWNCSFVSTTSVFRPPGLDIIQYAFTYRRPA